MLRRGCVRSSRLGDYTDRMSNRICVPLAELSLADIAEVGGKTASLGELTRELTKLGIRVPPGFAVTTAAYDLVLDRGETRDRLRRILDGLDTRDLADLTLRSAKARAAILAAGLPAVVAAAIAEAHRELEQLQGGEIEVAVRSSATAEDLPEASFAGQQATLLGVRGIAAVHAACLECFASLFTSRAIAYRAAHGIDHFAVRGAIAVQRMVRSDRGAAGVAFTLDPETGFRDAVLVAGAWGLGESVVAGRVDPDEVLVWKRGLDHVLDPILSRRIGTKETRIEYAKRGAETTRTVPVSDSDRKRRCFTDDDALQLAHWAVAIERHWAERTPGAPAMDIEWAKDGITGELFIVQARPETVHSRRPTGQLEYDVLSTHPTPLLRGVAVGTRAAIGTVRIVRTPEQLANVGPGDVIVADMTDPDWVPAMRKAAAIVTDRGGRTCHAAIVARELGVPCIVATGRGTAVLTDGQQVTIDCTSGGVGLVLPGHVPFVHETIAIGDLPHTRTKPMLILADPDQAFTHSRLPVAGVGLVRQEFIVANHIGIHPMAALHPERVDAEARARIESITHGARDAATWFTDRLVEGIATIAAAFYPRDVIVRLGDFKSNEYRRLIGGAAFEPTEENPMIGLRGASRYIHPDFKEAFDLECRALWYVRETMGLRNVQIMVPFCRTVEEGRAVVAALARNQLVRGEHELQVWVMCEIPSNVTVIDRFSEVFDGFSIGSNDLTQLVLGVDRDSELLADTFRETDEAVMRTIAAAIHGAHVAGRPIGLCGQAPSDNPELARFLVERGIDSISVTPDAARRVLQVIADAEKVVRQ
jgi:pyruvate,water dikinase